MAAHHASHDKPCALPVGNHLTICEDGMIAFTLSHNTTIRLLCPWLYSMSNSTQYDCACGRMLSLALFFPSNKPFIRVSQTRTSVLCPVNLNKKIQYSIPIGLITVILWFICFIFSLWIATMILNLQFNNDHVAYLNAERFLLLNFLQLWII